jgi:DNA (cytosine-5)-methyltransferase 1
LKSEITNLQKKNLKEIGLESDKSTVLKPGRDKVSTIMTITDDYIHSNPRSLTVCEMARLQSFDDSFVFQGKRLTEEISVKFRSTAIYIGWERCSINEGRVALEILKNIKYCICDN